MFKFLKKYGSLFGSWLNGASLLLVLSALLLWVVFPSQAADDATDGATEEEGEEVICILYIKDNVTLLTDEIIQFLSEHYLSEDPASSLAETAFLKYQEYRANMNLLIDDYSKNYVGGSISQTEQAELLACKTYVDDNLRTVLAMLQNHNLQNAGAKTSYTLVSKLKDINDGLRDLNNDFGDMYGKFKLLSDKLPGYTK